MRPHLAGTVSVGKPPPPGSFLTGDNTSWIAAAACPLRGLLRWGALPGMSRLLAGCSGTARQWNPRYAREGERKNEMRG
jgi:hypothetical protein